VLVVGCNTGDDCRPFIEGGAREIVGIDVVAEVGRDFPHSRVEYVRASIEKCPLPNHSFDLIYSVATMEHVHDVRAGFAEMARMARGVIYSVASPLWHACHGHHMACFHGHPWVHLLHTRDEMIDYAKAHGIDGERGYTIEAIVDYVTSPDHFNRRHAHEYVDACALLEGVALEANSLDLENGAMLSHPLGRLAIARGFDSIDLLAVTHTLIARRS
jgi:SAM-dependent methyltransferase